MNFLHNFGKYKYAIIDSTVVHLLSTQLLYGSEESEVTF